ncbi:MAG: conserved protein of unknown function [Nitrospira sp.]
MSREPFITTDLRPDLTVQAAAMQPLHDGGATTEQLADAARAILSGEECLQVERGNQKRHRQLLQSVPRTNPNVQGSTLDGETVLLDLKTGRYYTLNRVGTAVWEHCIGRQSLLEIHEALCARFDASSERIADDLLALVTHLCHEGLLTLEGG